MLMSEKNENTKIENIIQNGMGLNIPISGAFLLSGVDKQKLLVESIKNDVLEYLKKHREAFLMDIVKEFNITISDAKLVFKKLENEGKIRVY